MSKQLICAIHQPDLFPWLGFFYKMKHCDIFVLHDDCFISKKSVTRRVKINSYDGEWWLTIPTKNKSNDICETIISNSTKWQKKIELRMIHSYKKTPFFHEYIDIFLDCLYYQNHNLSEYNIYGIKQIMKLLDIKKDLILSSSLNLKSSRTEKIINTLKSINSTVYLSGNGAGSYQEEGMFKINNFTLKYSAFKPTVYHQIHGNFTMGLSVWDVLFNIGSEKTKEHLL
jgi:hypothetical protein